MKPLIHATISAKKYGGEAEDYMEIHNFFDSSKATCADVRHRAILHSSFGIFLAERLFGDYIVNSEGKKVSVRDVGEDHVMDDLGFIPSVDHWVKNMAIQPWMAGKAKKNVRKSISFNNGEKNEHNKID